MSFDSFAPAPKDDRPKENLYGDILHSDDTDRKQKFDPNKISSRSKPDGAPAVTSTPLVVNTGSSPKIQGVRADRQRPVKDRGKLPDIVEKVTEKPKKKFPALMAAIIITAVIIVGVMSAGVTYIITNKSNSVATNTTAALAATGLVGMPDGVTGKQVLASTRVEAAKKELDKQVKAAAGQLAFLGKFSTAPGNPVAVLDPKGKKTPVLTASSDTYLIQEDVSGPQKERVISTINDFLGKQGYSKYDPANSGVDNPLAAPQLFISGVRTKNGMIENYGIVINNKQVGSNIASGIYITFYSSPHIKSGTDAAFTKFVVNSYNAQK